MPWCVPLGQQQAGVFVPGTPTPSFGRRFVSCYALIVVSGCRVGWRKKDRSYQFHGAQEAATAVLKVPVVLQSMHGGLGCLVFAFNRRLLAHNLPLATYHQFQLSAFKYFRLHVLFFLAINGAICPQTNTEGSTPGE